MLQPPLQSVTSDATNYRPDIDGLRAFAVLSVIVFHAFPSWLRGGFVGVDVFFVISGYLISGHIFSSLERGKFSLQHFYSKRIRRIFPALIAVLAVCLVFGWVTLLVDEYMQMGLHVAAGASFVSNFVLWSESSYFDTSAMTKPLIHLWSLGIEEQFYIVWPLLAWALWKSRLASLPVVMALLAASFALNITVLKADPTMAFYSPFTRMWELLAGAALAQWENQGNRMASAGQANVISTLGLTLLTSSVFIIDEGAAFPGWWATLPVIGTVMVIAAGKSAIVNRAVGLKPFTLIGLISYPLYLWHWPLLSFAHIIEGEAAPREMRVGLIGATFALAASTYYFIEKPLRFGRFSKSTVPITAAILAMLTIGFAGYSVWRSEGMPNRPAIRSMQEMSAEFGNALWKFTSNETCLNRYAFPEAKEYQWWFCITNKDAPPNVLLLGDSFANHHYPGIVSNPYFVGQTILHIGTCQPRQVQPTTRAPKSPLPCDGYRWFNQQKFIDEIINKGTIKLAILDGIPAVITPEIIEEVHQRVSFLESNGVRVVVFHPHLLHEGGDIKGCFARPFRLPNESCEIPTETIDRLSLAFKPLIESISRTNPNVRFFDQNRIFCTEGVCSFIADRKPLIRDDASHYSEFASKKLAALFTDWAKIEAPELLSAF